MTINRRHYSYKVDHDNGYAPNPFFSYMTLAGCKPHLQGISGIRNWIKTEWVENDGIWVIGKAGKYLYLEDYEYNKGSLRKVDGNIDANNRLIFAFKVREILDFEDYYKDPRFSKKKYYSPDNPLNIVGDNHLYEPVREDPVSLRYKCDKYDSQTIRCNKVLISEKNNFYYFGCFAPILGEDFDDVMKDCRNTQKFYDSKAKDLKKRLIEISPKKGISGFPSFNKQKKYRKLAQNEDYLREVFKKYLERELREELVLLIQNGYRFKNPSIHNVLQEELF